MEPLLDYELLQEKENLLICFAQRKIQIGVFVFKPKNLF
jgi:hypothetical protein